MSFLKQLFDQVNMRDGGKTFNNPTGNSGAKAGTPPSVMPSAVQASQMGGFFNQQRGTAPQLPTDRQPMQYMKAQPMQPFGVGQEDDNTPALETQANYYSPQTSRHGYFLQNPPVNPQESMGQTYFDGNKLRRPYQF